MQAAGAKRPPRTKAILHVFHDAEATQHVAFGLRTDLGRPAPPWEWGYRGLLLDEQARIFACSVR